MKLKNKGEKLDMADQFFNGPAPQQADFDSLNSKLTTTKYEISSSFSDITDLEYVQCLLFRSGNVVTFRLNGRVKDTITASTPSITKQGIIPAEYRPTSGDCGGLLSFRYSNYTEKVSITQNGDFSIDDLLSTTNAGKWMSSTITYVVE